MTRMSSSASLAVLALGAALLLVGPGTALAGYSVTLAWDANPPEEKVTGYVVHAGTTTQAQSAFDKYQVEVDVGNRLTCTLALPDGVTEFYFSVTARNAEGVVSEFSDEVSVYAVEASSGQGGAVGPSGVILVPGGSDQPFSISPQQNFKIQDVLVDGASVGPVSSYVLGKVGKPHKIQAVFAPTGSRLYTVWLSSGLHGSVSPSGPAQVADGKSLSFSVTPDPQYKISDVTLDRVSLGPVASYTIPAVTKNLVVSASFVSASAPPVVPGGSIGADGIADDWKLRYFNDPQVNAADDPDGDGISNLAEYRNGSDPTVANLNPALDPAVAEPVSGGVVTTTQPRISVHNPLEPPAGTISYRFEVATDRKMKSLAASQEGFPQGVGVTTWTVPTPLQNNTRYFWRARATNGAESSDWTPVCTFYLDTEGQATTTEIDLAEFVERDAEKIVEVTDTAKASGGVVVELPPDVLPYEFLLTLGAVTNPPLGTSGSRTRIVGKVMEFGPHGSSFAQPVTIMLPYTEKNLQEAGVDRPDRLAVLTYNTETLVWEPVSLTGVDYLGRRLIARVDHFSMYAVGTSEGSSTGANSETSTPSTPATGTSQTASQGSGGGGGGCFIRSLR